jgi:hypothetical protein
MRSSSIVRVAVAALLAAGASAGCSDGAKTADPKPVNVKEDPRLKREVSGSENKVAGQLPGNK